jgi:hypothetical protein
MKGGAIYKGGPAVDGKPRSPSGAK